MREPDRPESKTFRIRQAAAHERKATRLVASLDTSVLHVLHARAVPKARSHTSLPKPNARSSSNLTSGLFWLLSLVKHQHQHHDRHHERRGPTSPSP